MHQKVQKALLCLFLMGPTAKGCFPQIFSWDGASEKDEGPRGAKGLIPAQASSLLPTMMRRGPHHFDKTYEVFDFGKNLRDQIGALIHQKVTFILQDADMMAWPQNHLNGYSLEDPSREHMRQWAAVILKEKGGLLKDLPNGNLKQSFVSMTDEAQIELIQRALFSTITGEDL